MTILYEVHNNLYVNLTNKCPCSCTFCLRQTRDHMENSGTLWLEHEPSTEEIIAEFESFDMNKYSELVFCGFGAPTERIDVLLEIAKYAKDKFNIKTRINTNGIGNIINKRDVIPELANIIDEVSISLNAPTKEQYNEISKPKYENAYEAMLDFAEKCVENNIKTTLTVVDEYPTYKLDIQKCKEIADKIGANFKVRKWLNNGY